MAARLTVVVSQSSARDSQAAELEENLVAELMMTDGLDATMVGPLESVDPSDTDFLCISSFNHSFVVASWLPLSEMQSHWQRLNLVGNVTDIENPLPVAADVRRIYHVHLNANLDSNQLIPRLRQIVRDRNTSTIGIGSLTTTPTSKSETNPRASPIHPEPTFGDLKTPPTSPAEKEGRTEPVPNPEEAQDPEWSHLDELIDEFDSLDL